MTPYYWFTLQYGYVLMVSFVFILISDFIGSMAWDANRRGDDEKCKKYTKLSIITCGISCVLCMIGYIMMGETHKIPRSTTDCHMEWNGVWGEVCEYL